MDHNCGEEIQGRDAVILTLAGAVADFAAAMEAERALQSMTGPALVQPPAYGVANPGHSANRA